jgi:hypothetical protein
MRTRSWSTGCQDIDARQESTSRDEFLDATSTMPEMRSVLLRVRRKAVLNDRKSAPGLSRSSGRSNSTKASSVVVRPNQLSP